MRFTIGLALVALSLSAAAEAQKVGKPLTAQQRVDLFTAADKNGDGRLEKSEWLLTLPKETRSHADVDIVWSRVDKAGRGFVDRQTFVRVGRHPSE